MSRRAGLAGRLWDLSKIALPGRLTYNHAVSGEREAHRPRHETMMCASRQAIVVTGAGIGSGDAKSKVHSPEPADIGEVEVPRGRCGRCG
jgi:hypothetical protein